MKSSFFITFIGLALQATVDADEEFLDGDELKWSMEEEYWDTRRAGVESNKVDIVREDTSGCDVSFEGKLRRDFALSLLFNDSISRIRNMVISPLTSLVPLGSLAFGATGDTLSELLEAIGSKTLDEVKWHFKTILGYLRNKVDLRFNMCSLVIVDKDEILNSSYTNDTTELFGNVGVVDLSRPAEAVNKINDYISGLTQKRIRNFFDSPNDVSPNSSLILVNAVYLAADWQYPFSHTTEGIFHGDDRLYKVTMMVNDARYRYYNSSDLNAELIEIRYASKQRTSLIVILPHNLNTTNITVLLKDVKNNPELLRSAMKEMKFQQVKLSLPVFTVDTQIDLNEHYKNIGLKAMFQGGLDNIVENKTLAVTRAVQLAVLNVSPRGTTDEMVAEEHEDPSSNSIHFTANRPFLFYLLIRDQTLFAGVVRHFVEESSGSRTMK